MDKPTKDGQDFKLRWVYPEGLASHYVTNFIVAHQPDLFTLSAHEVFAPLGPALTGEPLPDRIDAVAVSRLTMSVEAAKKLHKVLGKNIEKYDATFGTGEEEASDD